MATNSFLRRAEGTPYADGYFRVKFKFTDEFPTAPPKCECSFLLLHTSADNTLDRLVCNEDIPSQCFQLWRDLCEHTEKGLEVNVWDWPYPHHR